MTANQLSKMINHGEGKEALDQMISEGMSADEIRDLYDSINFYPNNETCKYIEDHTAARKNKEALDGFFSNLTI